jgi:hypothetical protein
MIDSEEGGPAGLIGGPPGEGLGSLRVAVGDVYNLPAETFLGDRGRPRMPGMRLLPGSASIASIGRSCRWLRARSGPRTATEHPTSSSY